MSDSHDLQAMLDFCDGPAGGKLVPFVTKLNLHMVPRLVQLQENMGERGTDVSPASAPQKPKASSQVLCYRSIRCLLKLLGIKPIWPPSLLLSETHANVFMFHSNRKHIVKGIRGDVAQHSQADSLQPMPVLAGGVAGHRGPNDASGISQPCFSLLTFFSKCCFFHFSFISLVEKELVFLNRFIKSWAVTCCL